MKQRTKTVCALVMAVLMSLNLCACGEQVEEEETNTIPNPVTEVTEEELTEQTGVILPPMGEAEDVHFFVIDTGEDKKMAEMTFSLDGREYDYRAQKRLGIDPVDLSGMYYVWTTETETTIAHCTGRYLSCEEASVVCWLDKIPGLAYTLSTMEMVEENDLREIACSTFLPMERYDEY